MNRVAHLWFLLGVLVSCALALVIWVGLSGMGTIKSTSDMMIVGGVELAVVLLVVGKLFKRYRARRRMHERISRELRCPAIQAEAGR